MRKFSWIIIIVSCLAACKSEPAVQVVRPVKVIVAGGGLTPEKSFPGFAEAQQYSYLDFRVGGMLIALNVEEGQNVAKGELLARLDPRDYELRVSASLASYRQSSLQLERYKNLYAREAISRQEYEMIQARNENNRTVYNKAVNDLNDTRLRAPFQGNIEAKYVENHQQVAPGQKIVKLTDPGKLQFRFVLPETMTGLLHADSVTWTVSFDVAPARSFAAYVANVVASSAEGAGIPVILRIGDPAFDPVKMKILAGDACSILAELPEGSSAAIVVPLSAVHSDPRSGAVSVWTVARADSTLLLVPVQTGGLAGVEDIEILSGLSAGDLVVTAGGATLFDGEKVKITGGQGTNRKPSGP